MSEYFCISNSDDNRFCFIDQDPPFEKWWRVTKGLRMDSRYPLDTQFSMSKKKHGIVVSDYICNSLLMCMVSSRLKSIFENEAEAEIEFLPFTLINHKERIVATDCYLANIIGTMDCIDMEKTDARKSLSEPGTFMYIFRLYLDQKQIDKNRKLFRLKQEPSVIIIRDDLRNILEDNNITGIKYINMGDRF